MEILIIPTGIIIPLPIQEPAASAPILPQRHSMRKPDFPHAAFTKRKPLIQTSNVSISKYKNLLPQAITP